MTRRQPTNLVPLAPLSQRATWAKQPTEFDHHYREDLACPACGTDSTVGCIAGEKHNG